MENDIFAIICLNNARFMYGDTKDIKDSKQCLEMHKRDNYKLLKTKKYSIF